MTKEFKLSKERRELRKSLNVKRDSFISFVFRKIKEQDKEFIKRLKDKMRKSRSVNMNWENIIDKLSGDL